MKRCAWLLIFLLMTIPSPKAPWDGLAPYVNFPKGYAFAYFSEGYQIALPDEDGATGCELSILPKKAYDGVRGVRLSCFENPDMPFDGALLRLWFPAGPDADIRRTASSFGVEGLWITEGAYVRLILTDGGRRTVCAEAVLAETDEENAQDRRLLAAIAATFAFFSAQEGICMPDVE